MPVFNFDQSAFPMLTPQQTSPLGGVLSDAIAKRLAMAQTEKAEREVPFAGLSSLVKVLTGLTYSFYMPSQYQAKLAGNPAIWANMTPTQHEQSVALASAPGINGQASPGASALTPVIKQAMDIYNKQNKSSPGLIEGLKNWISGNQQQPQTPLGMPGAAQTPVANQPASSGLPIISPNLGEQPRAMQNQANYAAGQNQASAAGTATGNQSAKQLETAQQNSQNALQMDQLIDSALAKSKDVILKGPLLGNFAAYGPQSAQLLKDTNAMAVTLANQLYGANTTNAKDATATTLKLNIKDPYTAFTQFGEKLKAQNDRIKAQGTFYETLDALGITNPRQRDQIWFDFNAEYPPYNYKAHKPIYQNLGIDQSRFADFISKDVVNTKSLNKRIDTTLKKQRESEESSFVGDVNDEGIIEFGRDENGKFVRKK